MIRCASRTEATPGRDNQDRWAADPSSGWFAVADGIGGLADAARTAEAVVDLLVAGVPSACEPELAALLRSVSHRIRTSARYGPGNAGAAVAVLVVRSGVAVTAHLGDCRVRLLRDGRVLGLTVDHRRADGALTRFAGMPGAVDPAVASHPLHDRDLLVLSSDGLGVLDDAAVAEELAGVAADRCPPEHACEALVRRARVAGATDDVTVLVVVPGGGRP